METTVGQILPDGTIEKEYYGQGWIYKNWNAFENKTDEICYVGEHDEDKLAEGVGYKYNDFVRLAQEFINRNEDVQEYCKENNVTAEDIALNLFEAVDWQDPTTEIDQWETYGSYTE